MNSSSIDAVLKKARAACLDAGFDPDHIGEDGKPAWLHFVAEAQASPGEDQQTRDPLASLRMLEARDLNVEAAAPSENAPVLDPLEKLQELFEHEMVAANPKSGRPENSFAEPHMEDVSTLSSRPKGADPLEMLKALEGSGPERRGSDWEASVNADGAESEDF